MFGKAIRSKFAQQVPTFQIGRCIKPEFMFRWKSDCHDPSLRLFMPYDAWVAEIFFVKVNDRIFRVKAKCSPCIMAVTQILRFGPEAVITCKYSHKASSIFT